MNTTGLNETGNAYAPFYELDTDAAKAGFRLNGDKSSEVVYAFKGTGYNAPSATYIASEISERSIVSSTAPTHYFG
jgi:hypothetical protein